ncbi:MAG: molybdopterin-guanine dinucleotide biosynthesis protein B [Desulfobacterium sp.]|nr:molybdopterin-guanine dinucleotide biosynthesis protein B [Desulfobacterium sp.]
MKPLTIGITGKSGSGKTTLIEKIIPILKSRGHRLGVVKHARRGFQMDKTGKDSWRHKKAGAEATLVVSANTIALIKETQTSSLNQVLHYLSDMDLILVEGFKQEKIPKVEIFRRDAGHKEPLFLEDPNLIAFVTDSNFSSRVPAFDPDDAEAIALFIETQLAGHGQQDHDDQ